MNGSNANFLPRLTTAAATDRVVVGAGATVRGTGGTSDRFVENYGLIVAGGSGTLSLSGSGLQNTGVLRVEPGGTLSLLGSSTTPWSNAGTIELSGGTLNLGGQFTLAGLGNIVRSGGTVNIKGTLDSRGQSLEIPGSYGPFRLSGGTLLGGTVNTATSGLELVSGSLRGVAFHGDLSITSNMNIQDTFSADGAVRISPGRSLTATNTVEIPDGDFVFDTGSTSTAVLGGVLGQSVTLGPATTVVVSNGTRAAVGSPGVFVHHGDTTVTGTGSWLEFSGENRGTMSVSGGALLVLGNSHYSSIRRWRNSGVINL
jgi:hypothetical protein